MNSEPSIESQLQERELGKLLLKSSGFFERFGLTLLAVLAAVVIGSIGYIVYSTNQTARLAAAWSDVEGTTLPADMEALAERYAGTPPGEWARLRAAELRFDEGMLQVNRNRAAANSEFKESKLGFEKVLAENKSANILRERALFGLARVLEATSNADTKPAISKYEELVSEFPQSIFKPIADERIKALASPETKSFYEWYSQQNPKPESPARPRDGLGGALGLPGLDLPGMTPTASPAGGNSSPVKSTDSPVKSTEGDIPPAAAPGTTDTPKESATPKDAGTPDPALPPAPAKPEAAPAKPETPAAEKPATPEASTKPTDSPAIPPQP